LNPGGGTGEFRANTYTTGNQDEPSVAMDNSGNFVVVWSSSQDGSGRGVFGQRFASDGTPVGPEFRVNSFTTGDQYQATLVQDSTTGNYLVIWNSVGQDGDWPGVFGQRYSAAGALLGPEFRVNTYTTGAQYRAALPADNYGSFVVAWQDGAAPGGGSPGRGIFAQRYDASSGVPLGPEFQVNSYTTGFHGSPAVSRWAGGLFVVVWHSDGQDGSGLGVFGQRYANTGAPFGSEFRVNTYITGNEGYPAAANDGVGCVLVGWESDGQDGSGPGVFAQLYYLGSFPPQHPEWQFNTYTTGSQSRASIMGGQWGYVVTWQSEGQDGSGYGVYAKGETHAIPVELMQLQVE
jgi:hypothetical protein